MHLPLATLYTLLFASVVVALGPKYDLHCNDDAFKKRCSRWVKTCINGKPFYRIKDDWKALDYPPNPYIYSDLDEVDIAQVKIETKYCPQKCTTCTTQGEENPNNPSFEVRCGNKMKTGEVDSCQYVIQSCSNDKAGYTVANGNHPSEYEIEVEKKRPFCEKWCSRCREKKDIVRTANYRGTEFANIEPADASKGTEPNSPLPDTNAACTPEQNEPAGGASSGTPPQPQGGSRQRFKNGVKENCKPQ